MPDHMTEVMSAVERLWKASGFPRTEEPRKNTTFVCYTGTLFQEDFCTDKALTCDCSEKFAQPLGAPQNNQSQFILEMLPVRT